MVEYFNKNSKISKDWYFSECYHYQEFCGEQYHITFDDGCSDDIIIQVYNVDHNDFDVIDGLIVKCEDILHAKDFLVKCKDLLYRYSPSFHSDENKKRFLESSIDQ